MHILEMFDSAPTAYHNPREDNTVLKMDDSRKTRLTLAHLNQLRQTHDIKKLEHEKKLEKIAKQYTPPAAGAGPLGI